VSLIVEAFVSLKDRVALEEMRDHRPRLRNDLLLRQNAAGSSFNFGSTIKLVDEDLAAIDAGFDKLDGASVEQH